MDSHFLASSLACKNAGRAPLYRVQLQLLCTRWLLLFPYLWALKRWPPALTVSPCPQVSMVLDISSISFFIFSFIFVNYGFYFLGFILLSFKISSFIVYSLIWAERKKFPVSSGYKTDQSYIPIYVLQMNQRTKRQRWHK